MSVTTTKKKFLTKAEIAAKAMQTKLELTMMYNVMQQGLDEDDKKDLLSAYDKKVKTMEQELAAENDLFASVSEKRAKILGNITSYTDKLENFSEFNYLKEGDKYYKLRHPSPRDNLWLQELEDPKSQGKKVRFKNKEEEGTGIYEVGSSLRVDLDPIKIEISKDVYDSVVDQRNAYTALIDEERSNLSAANEEYVNLLDTWRVRNVKGAKPREKFDKAEVRKARTSWTREEQFKIDSLKEQIASQEVFLRMYQNNRMKYTGIKWNEDARKWMPINYDAFTRRQTEQNLRESFSQGEKHVPAAFKLKTNFMDPMVNDMNERRNREYLIQPRTWYERNIPGQKGVSVREDLSKGPIPDFTSNYIQLKLAGGTTVTKAQDTLDPNSGIVNTKVESPGVKNPDYVDWPNSPKEQQKKVKHLLWRKNQNVNPSGIKKIDIMKGLLKQPASK